MKIVSYALQSPELGTGYVYKWTNLVNGMMYIGKHNGSDPDYIGSGVDFLLAVKEFGIENFFREILYCGANFSSVEEQILTTVGTRQSPNFYNRINTWSEGTLGKTWSPEVRAKQSAAQKGVKKSEAHRESMRKAWEKGRMISDETRQKLSEAGKRRYRSEEERKRAGDATRGRIRPQEERDRISASQKGKPNRGNHTRWHAGKGTVKPDCIFCTSEAS